MSHIVEMEPVIVALLVLTAVALVGVIVNSVFIFDRSARESIEGSSKPAPASSTPPKPADAASISLGANASLAYQLDGNNTVRLWLDVTRAGPLDTRVGWPASIRPSANLSISFDGGKRVLNIDLVQGIDLQTGLRDTNVDISTSYTNPGTYYMAYSK